MSYCLRLTNWSCLVVRTVVIIATKTTIQGNNRKAKAKIVMLKMNSESLHEGAEFYDSDYIHCLQTIYEAMKELKIISLGYRHSLQRVTNSTYS